ncbi:MAG: hypothetical protein ACI4XD_00075 [Clostridia bacterium]
MGYKLNKALKKSKTSLIIALVLWVIITIVLVSPISYAVARSMINNKFDLNQFLTEIGPAITNISTLVKVFSEGHGPTFWKTWQIFSVIYLAFAIIGIIKARPKHEYTDIEHGSSDWSEGGEQYKVLSKNKGIILAQDNYLPIDKRGNVNVLVVGRFWFW